MSYFDHVRCSACKAMLDPENLISVQGQGMSCPQCRAPLSLKDLFGLRAAFAEEESPDLSLDALVSGFDEPSPRGASSGGARPAPEGEGGDAPSALDVMRSMKKRR